MHKEIYILILALFIYSFESYGLINEINDSLLCEKNFKKAELDLNTQNYTAAIKYSNNAYKYRSLASSTKDSLNTETKSQLMIELETEYDKLQMEETISKQKKSNNRLILVVVLFLFLIILLFVIFVKNKTVSRRLYAKNNEIILQRNLIFEQNEELRIQTEELQAQTEELKTQAEELSFHQGNLEKIVEQRTADLLIAKVQAEESNQLKTAFLNNISHEFRTPMNGIIGFASLLINSNSTKEEQKLYASIIDKSCNQLLNIVNDTVEISKVQNKQVEITKTPTNLANIISDIVDEFQESILQKKLVLKLDLNLKKGQLIFTDTNKVQRIFWHLISNAVKFTHNGSIKITGQVLENYLQFEIKDTGIGILPELQTKIFESFRQVETGMSKNYGGNGIGLSLSKAYVEFLGGKIWLKSELEKGTTIFFTISF